MLQDKEFFLSCNPHMDKFEARGQVEKPELPESIKPLGPTTLYNVTDIVETLPKGLWSSNVESTYEFTDTELGTFCALRSPMNVVMHTFWSIEEKDSGLELVEACEIKCSRLLIGIVKSLNEGGCEYSCTILLVTLAWDWSLKRSALLECSQDCATMVGGIDNDYMLTGKYTQGPRSMPE